MMLNVPQVGLGEVCPLPKRSPRLRPYSDKDVCLENLGLNLEKRKISLEAP